VAWSIHSHFLHVFPQEQAGGGDVFEGGLSELYVYSKTSGDLLATCSPLSMNSFNTSFINDVTVKDGMA